MQKPMPRSFEYISRRLIRKLFGEIEQGKPEWKLDAFKFDAKIVPISLDAKRSARQENIYWMTEYVTREIDQITGSIVYPGTYVRCTMEFTWDVLSQTVRATGQPVDFG